MRAFTVSVELLDDGLYHQVVTNGAGRQWYKHPGEQFPDNLGEGAIELEYHINVLHSPLSISEWDELIPGKSI